MRRMMGIVMLIGAVLFILAAWLPFVLAQEATVSPAPAPTVIQPDWLTGLLVILLAISEGLAMIPALKANGIVHMLILVLKRMSGKPLAVLLVVVALGSLGGCAALETVTKVAGQVRDLAGKIYDGLGGGGAPPERSNDMKPPTPANP